jgi:rSAM/selenodomain-associated transferase 2
MSGSTLISIITPLLNEEAYVKPFLEHLRDLEGNFELILVDGGSSDGTLEEVQRSIQQFDFDISLLKANRGRAVQMNRGAEKASGRIILFLHVDCFLPKYALRLVEREILNNGAVGGGFTHSFLNPDFFLRIVSIFGNLRSRLTKTFFGDFGIFFRKDVFQKIGGYDDLPFLEDVEICRRAKKYGSLINVDCCIFTSTRRYVSKGELRLTVMYVLASFLNFLRVRPRFFVNCIANK